MAKILLIDDDVDIIDSLTRVLEKNGYSVSVKNDTEHVVADVARIDPDLIILDVMFPQDPYAGFKAARELKADKNVGHIPILVLSAVNQRTGQAFGFSDSDISDNFLPVQGFVEKPVEPKLLIEKVRALLTPSIAP